MFVHYQIVFLLCACIFKLFKVTPSTATRTENFLFVCLIFGKHHLETRETKITTTKLRCFQRNMRYRYSKRFFVFFSSSVNIQYTAPKRITVVLSETAYFLPLLSFFWCLPSPVCQQNRNSDHNCFEIKWKLSNSLKSLFTNGIYNAFLHAFSFFGLNGHLFDKSDEHRRGEEKKLTQNQISRTEIEVEEFKKKIQPKWKMIFAVESMLSVS